MGLGAFGVTPVDPSTDEVVATCPHEWDDAPIGSADPTLQLRLLCMRSGGRGCSGRQGSPCTSRPRGSTGRTCGSPRAGAATTCTFLSDIAVNIASMDY